MRGARLDPTMVAVVVGYEYRPGVLYLNVTNRCSNDCTFCVRGDGSFSLAGFDLRLEREPDAAAVLADVARAEAARGGAYDEVVFCGFGEPTYRLELIRAVGGALRQRGTAVRLNTNGQVELIQGHGACLGLCGAVDAVSVSLNAPDADRYVALCRPRHGADAFTAVVDFARFCRDRFERVSLTAVGSALDHVEAERCAELAARLGAAFRLR